MNVPTVTLPGGVEAPQLGLGTWTLRGGVCERTVRSALEIGYRHIDTAEMYENEEAVGRAIASVDRDDLFLTSKVWPDHLHAADVRRACESSLQRLDTDYLDLYLIHWPNGSVPIEETIGALRQLAEEGRIRAWGVSNFTRAHLEEARRLGTIAVNQVELHPFFNQQALAEYCNGIDLPITAYRPLAKGRVNHDHTLSGIALHHGRSPAQVALRWIVQRGHLAIPRSANERHLRENIDVFDFHLDASEMDRIDGLNKGERLVAIVGAEFDRDDG
ncbi:MAG: aldo/keto reductase [Gemmatimonadota bacterium]|jgi:2,5-diketo-D-gluconate reductase B